MPESRSSNPGGPDHGSHLGPHLGPDHGADLLAGLRLAGRGVVVAGGAALALGPVTRLLAAGASVTVHAADVVDSLRDLAERGRLTWSTAPLDDAAVDAAWLVVAATGDDDGDEAVLARADALRVLSWRPRPARGPGGLGGAGGAGGPGGPRPTAGTAAPTPPRPAAADASDSSESFAAPVAPGTVTLVGGGPGDPGLLTVAGLAALRAAEVVVTDRLAPLEALADLDPGVEVIDVAKIPRGAFTPQERINEILVEHALAGRRVVRFKGGDSFVFGRGMEEVLACREAGVPTRVVPGVTSSVSAPALAGIPVTHRGVVQGFAVVSGHVPPGDPRGSVDWAALGASGLTLVVLMGVATLPQIARALLDAGREPGTPVGIVMDAGLASQRAVRSTLRAAAAGVPDGVSAPAVTVVGEVAAFLDEAERGRASEATEPVRPGTARA